MIEEIEEERAYSKALRADLIGEKKSSHKFSVPEESLIIDMLPILPTEVMQEKKKYWKCGHFKRHQWSPTPQKIVRKAENILISKGWKPVDLALFKRPKQIDVESSNVKERSGLLYDHGYLTVGTIDRTLEPLWKCCDIFIPKYCMYYSSDAQMPAMLKIVRYTEQAVAYYKLEEQTAHVWIARQHYPTKGRVWHPAAHPFIGQRSTCRQWRLRHYHAVSEYPRRAEHRPVVFLTDTEVSVQPVRPVGSRSTNTA